MKTKLLHFIAGFYLFAGILSAKAQTYPNDIATGYNATLDRFEWYVKNSPTNSVGNRKVLIWMKASEFHIESDSTSLKGFNGSPTKVAVLSSNSRINSKSMSYFMPRSSAETTIDSINTALSDKANIVDVYSKIQSDLKYYLLSNPSGYIATEVDPNVANYIKSITLTEKTNWNTAYSWGNPAGVYYPLTNPAGYISNIPAQTFASLTGKPTTLSGYGITDAYPNTNPNSYISTYTETDPIWNAQKTSYSTKIVADGLYKPIAYQPAWGDVTSKPTFATVATSGSYTDLTDKPTLGTASAQSTSAFATATQGSKADSALQSEVDGSTSNELQSLTYNTGSGSLGISSGNSVSIPLINNANVVSALGGTPLFSEVDGSVTNEIELPIQTGQSGKLLTTNGSTPSWTTASTGTVISVGATAGAGIGISGSPVTTNGSFTITNTSPDQTVVLTNGGTTTTSGTYPNFNITSSNTPYSSYGVGTSYTLSTTSAKITFGTTSPSITLGGAGTYLLLPQLKINYNGVTSLSVGDCAFKVRRSNNTASDIANSTTAFTIPILTLLTSTAGDADYPSLVYTTATSGDILELWGNRPTTITVGSVTVNEASIVAIKIN